MAMANKKVADFPLVKTHAAGIDVGAQFHVVAIPEHLSDNPVREFSSLSRGLKELAGFLKEHGITEAALEATGVYWVPLFNVLEEHGIKPYLMNPRSLKSITRKKSDVLDCQWILKIFSHDIIGTHCFVPDKETSGLRELVRCRAGLIADAARNTNTIIKTLRLMNINLEMAVTDVQGETGMRIISAIVGGERNPNKLAAMRDQRCKHSAQEIAANLDGTFTGHHLTNLEIYHNTHEHYLKMIEKIDGEILAYLRTMPTSENHGGTYNNNRPFPDHKKPTAGQTRVKREKDFFGQVASECHRILGVDITLIEGIGPNALLTFLSEIGTCLDAFDSPGKLASYLGLSPRCDISGGKKLSKATKKVKHRLAHALRLAARSLWRSKSWLGAFYRKMRARQGTPKAITTTAHKLVRLIYGLIKNGRQYVTYTVATEEAKLRNYKLGKLMSQAKELGLDLVKDGQKLEAVNA
jgi:transposase